MFNHHLRELYHDGSFRDIKVRSGERVWDLHQVVLARHSVRFLQTQTEHIIELDPNLCPEESVNIVISYLYGDRLHLNDDLLGSIMAVAASLGIHALIRICSERIKKLVSNSSTSPLKYITMAESHGTRRLVDFLMDVASRRMRVVAEDTEEFEKLSPENVCKLIEGRKLDVFLIGRVISWMEKDPESRGKVWKCMDLKEAGIKELDRLHNLAIPGITMTLLNCYRDFCIKKLPKMETSKPVREWPVLEEHCLVAIGGKTDGGPPGTCVMVLSLRMNFPYWKSLPSIPQSYNCEYFPHIQWANGKIIVFGVLNQGILRSWNGNSSKEMRSMCEEKLAVNL